MVVVVLVVILNCGSVNIRVMFNVATVKSWQLFVSYMSVHCVYRTKPVDRQRRVCLHKGDDDVSCGHSALPFTNHCLRRILWLLFVSEFCSFSVTLVLTWSNMF